MKKIPYIKIFGLVVAVLLAAKMIFDFDGFWELFSLAGSAIVSLLGYILIGFVIAYIINSYINVWRNRILKKWTKNQKAKKYLTIIIGYVSFAAIVALFLFAIIPALYSSITSLGKEIPNLIDYLIKHYDNIIASESVLAKTLNQMIETVLGMVGDVVISLVDFATITNIVTTTTSVIFNAVMGIIISVYMLIEKEAAIGASERIIFSLFHDKTALRIRWAARKINMIFQKYLSGKLLQAFCVMIIAYIVFLIAGLPYAILFAVVLALLNMIPYIGPWVSAVPIVVICLADSFWSGVIAVICILIIQAIDNWLISPKVIGDTIGVSPLLVLIGLCIGGALFGVWGMVIGDAMAAIVKVFFYDTYVEIRRRRKAIEKKSKGDLIEIPPEDSDNDTDDVDEIDRIFVQD
ncbi:MAG: AI-2E family transporter [Ruminococcaceae bacterium]|nr:AI-2E family transporter [Oscillospiraceae bacterium]